VIDLDSDAWARYTVPVVVLRGPIGSNALLDAPAALTYDGLWEEMASRGGRIETARVVSVAQRS
jgi:hypothetical protein